MVAMTPTRTAAIAAARRNHGVITYQRLRELGLSREEIRHLVVSERSDACWSTTSPRPGSRTQSSKRESHDIRIAFVDDRRRDRHNAAAGYLTLRFTWAEIEHDPDTVAAELADVGASASSSSA